MASVPASAGLTPNLSRPHPQPLLASPPTPLRMERGVICEVTPIGLLTRFLDSSFSHRTHRFNRTFLPTFRTHRTPPAYREHRGLSTNISCNALCFRL